LFELGDDPAQNRELIRRRKEYVERISDQLPESAKAYALASLDWSHNPSGALHDGWFESLTIDELGAGTRREVRQRNIRLRLLGAFHDGYVELSYRKVVTYSCDMTLATRRFNIGHGDLLYDEIQLTSEGKVRHVIEFESGLMTIDCADIEYKWTRLTECPDPAFRTT
jgi:hypothetical protein